MIKNKLDFKLINLAIITLIIFLIYLMNDFWGGLLYKIWTIILPFVIAFVVAYALYPLLKYLERKGLPKSLGLIIIVVLVLSFLSILGILVIPLLIEQLSNLFNNIILFMKELSLKHDLNFGLLQETLASSFNSIIVTLGNYVSDGAINFINVSFSVISNTIIVLAAAVYFLIDMDNIRDWFKSYVVKKSPRTYRFFIVLDKEMKSYLAGFASIVLITFVEYTIVYYIIKHPSALLLGILAALGNLIPFFGALLVNSIAGITAAVNLPFPGLLINTIIAIFVLSIVDTYVINPTVYKRTNRVHPIIVILSVFAGGYLFGFMGIIISLPVAIIIITTYKFYKTDIYTKISDIKETKKKQTKKAKENH
ncbi:MAG: AI-2E family transporter [Bacilli bacterium]|nr:AI-2E family transporter [Bacilli bacterium]MDD4282806.1 AI-2E family transporter [Bacilli bacterium]MDD4718879.1 AI-2E family transporter [Bacilli bacterium]